MHYRAKLLHADLERLATLDASAIDLVGGDPDAASQLIGEAFDEALDLDERADEAEVSGQFDDAAFLRQEASAWRATITVLRMASAATRADSRAADHSGRGVA